MIKTSKVRWLKAPAGNSFASLIGHRPFTAGSQYLHIGMQRTTPSVVYSHLSVRKKCSSTETFVLVVRKRTLITVHRTEQTVRTIMGYLKRPSENIRQYRARTAIFAQPTASA